MRQNRNEAGTAEDHELEADPAHPAPIQGSDGRRAQSEAAKEEQHRQNQKAETEN
jgi:hypothetical protein